MLHASVSVKIWHNYKIESMIVNFLNRCSALPFWLGAYLNDGTILMKL